MTNEQLKDLRDAIDAHLNGKTVQFNFRSRGWVDCANSVTGENLEPKWFFNDTLYRPKPEPKTRPWQSPADVPGPVCWMRQKGYGGLINLIQGINDLGVFMRDPEVRLWDSLSWFEYSTDRKTWQPCTVTEP